MSEKEPTPVDESVWTYRWVRNFLRKWANREGDPSSMERAIQQTRLIKYVEGEIQTSFESPHDYLAAVDDEYGRLVCEEHERLAEEERLNPRVHGVVLKLEDRSWMGGLMTFLRERRVWGVPEYTRRAAERISPFDKTTMDYFRELWGDYRNQVQEGQRSLRERDPESTRSDRVAA